MKVKCTCGKEYEIAAALIGKAVRCQSCHKSFLVPVPKAPRQQSTMQMTAVLAPPTRPVDQQRERGAAASDPLVTQWVPVPVAASEAKARTEREQQIIAQYVAYIPKAGDKLRGADLAIAQRKLRQRSGRKLGFSYLGLGIGAVLGAIFGYFKLAAMEAGDPDPDNLHWIMNVLFAIGGKWAAAIGLGLIGLGLLGIAVMYLTGVFGEREG